MPVVWSDRHRMHDPGGEVWVGVRTPGTEVPERAERIREALAAAGARLVDAEEQPDEAVLAVHDAPLVEYLATAWDEWEASGLTDDPGQDRVVPYLFPHPGLFPEASPPRRGARGACSPARRPARIAPAQTRACRVRCPPAPVSSPTTR